MSASEYTSLKHYNALVTGEVVSNKGKRAVQANILSFLRRPTAPRVYLTQPTTQPPTTTTTTLPPTTTTTTLPPTTTTLPPTTTTTTLPPTTTTQPPTTTTTTLPPTTTTLPPTTTTTTEPPTTTTEPPTTTTEPPTTTTTTLPLTTTTTTEPPTTTTEPPTTTTEPPTTTTTTTTLPIIYTSVSTFAGIAQTSGYQDGIGSAGRFNFPRSMVVDSDNNLYVCDIGNNRIRKVTPAGVVTTLAGSGSYSYLDGIGINAHFASPYGITIDSLNNLYISDNGNSKIRKVTPGGVVTTLDGVGINSPFEMSIDSDDNLYVCEYGSNSILKITLAGVVTRLAGSGNAGYLDGIGINAAFNNPRGIAVDSSNNLYIVDSINNRIRKVTPAGVVTTVAGEGSAGYVDGIGSIAQFNGPLGIAINSHGDLFVGDANNNRIRKVTPAGVVTTVAGTGVAGYIDGDINVTQFEAPSQIVFDSLDNMYVTSFYSHSIRKITV
jgi:sugar lactone lactonase YvrE